MKRSSAVTVFFVACGMLAVNSAPVPVEAAAKTKTTAKAKAAPKTTKTAKPSAETISWGKAQCDTADKLLAGGECEKAKTIYAKVLEKLPASPRAKEGINKANAAITAKQGEKPAQENAPAPKDWTTKEINADPVALSDQFVAYLANHDYNGAAGMFDAQMKEMMSPDKLKEAVSKLTSESGELQKQVESRKAIEQGFECIYVTCAFEKATMDVKLVFDKENKISGLWFLPASKE